MSSLELAKSLPYYYYDYQCSKVSVESFLLFIFSLILGSVKHVNHLYG
jgi:hypothetical protein